ncbi:fimbria/pilus chaperone family protein [Enterobacter cloacae]|uniref:fimbria/pilus chaperone family protein n=1 Tax=Enterobacter cloacae TaxID=550 RepID=UPI0030EE1722
MLSYTAVYTCNTPHRLVIMKHAILSSVFFIAPLMAHAAGMLPETSVVIVEQQNGEGVINVRNTDSKPSLLLTTLINIKGDDEMLLSVTPPVARVEPGKSQRVRFIMTSKEPLKSERLKRVIFEGVPPQKKGGNEVQMTVSQNLPVIIRPAGLEKDPEPWKRLTWKQSGNTLTVSNPSPYVVRMASAVTTMPGNATLMIPDTFILPGQTISATAPDGTGIGNPDTVRISPASAWGYSVQTYDAPITK